MDRDRNLSRARFRVTLLALLSTLWVSALVGRLVYLQVFLRESLQERAEIQQSYTMKLDPERGTIYDRNGRELAVSVNVESVYAVPRAIKEADRTARALADCLPVDSEELAIRLRSDKSFLWVDRKVDLATADCVRELDLAGVNFVPERRRFYPKRRLAAHVLGYVGMDNEGMSGVEYAFEEEIRGEDGRQIIWTDARNRPAASRVEKRPQPGRNLLLTIDETLQHIVQSELEEAVRESGSKGGVAILLQPETGEILAMAEVPGFNPNRYGDYPPSNWRNRSVTDAYEPGSTFKIVSAAAALEEGVVSEDERIDCGRGVIRVGDRVIHDHREFDVLTFREVLEKSSNVGMIRIGQRLGVDVGDILEVEGKRRTMPPIGPIEALRLEAQSSSSSEDSTTAPAGIAAALIFFPSGNRRRGSSHSDGGPIPSLARTAAAMDKASVSLRSSSRSRGCDVAPSRRASHGEQFRTCSSTLASMLGSRP